MSTIALILPKGNNGKPKLLDFKRLLAYISIVLILISGEFQSAYATSTITATAWVGIGDGENGITYLANNTTAAYQVYAEAGAFSLLPHDVYLAVLTPDGKIFSWDDSPHHQLTNGLVPYEKNIVRGSFYTQETPGYKFTDEANGIYHVYVIVTASGADPYNPINWVVATSSPLIYQPATNSTGLQ